MITITTVEKCPYTVAGTGVVRINHDVLAILAGAVYDSIEWMAILEGTRSDNGLDITVTGLRVPKQTRNSKNCEFDNPEPLHPGDVGVVHSHHSMVATFSPTDHNSLNPRFPFSIVVAQPRHNDSEAKVLMGFSYSAEGRAALPCGSNGIIKFIAIPAPMDEDWPTQPVVGYAAPDQRVVLHECPHKESTYTKGSRTQSCLTLCGITTTEKANAIFGRRGKQFIKEVEDKTVASKGFEWGGNQGVNGGQMVVVDNRKGGDGYKRRDWEESMYRPDGSWKHWSDF